MSFIAETALSAKAGELRCLKLEWRFSAIETNSSHFFRSSLFPGSSMSWLMSQESRALFILNRKTPKGSQSGQCHSEKVRQIFLMRTLRTTIRCGLNGHTAVCYNFFRIGVTNQFFFTFLFVLPMNQLSRWHAHITRRE